MRKSTLFQLQCFLKKRQPRISAPTSAENQLIPRLRASVVFFHPAIAEIARMTDQSQSHESRAKSKATKGNLLDFRQMGLEPSFISGGAFANHRPVRIGSASTA
jgi:hypothetical protein